MPTDMAPDDDDDEVGVNAHIFLDFWHTCGVMCSASHLAGFPFLAPETAQYPFLQLSDCSTSGWTWNHQPHHKE